MDYLLVVDYYLVDHKNYQDKIEYQNIAYIQLPYLVGLSRGYRVINLIFNWDILE